eukprot:2853517-Rhodomonas_salina.1
MSTRQGLVQDDLARQYKDVGRYGRSVRDIAQEGYQEAKVRRQQSIGSGSALGLARSQYRSHRRSIPDRSTARTEQYVAPYAIAVPHSA